MNDIQILGLSDTSQNAFGECLNIVHVYHRVQVLVYYVQCNFPKVTL